MFASNSCILCHADARYTDNAAVATKVRNPKIMNFVLTDCSSSSAVLALPTPRIRAAEDVNIDSIFC